MWIGIILVAAIIGAVLGYAQKGDSREAVDGAVAGGCMAAGCVIRIAMVAIGILLVLWLFSVLFG